MNKNTNKIWLILIGIFLSTLMLLIFFGDLLRENGLHKVTFFVCAFLGIPCVLYLLTKVLNVKE